MAQANDHQTTKPVIFLAFANDREQYLHNLHIEQRGIREALKIACEEGLCEVVERNNTTINDIFDVFQEYQNRVAVFHYGGHADDYLLLLETDAGERAPAHSGGLVSFLARQKGLQLVFINGCCSKRQALDLAKAGVPAVVGTAQPIDDAVAPEISTRFYKGLAGGLTIERAWKDAADQIRSELGDDKLQPQSQPLQTKDSVTFAWDIYYRDGAEKVKDWNLPDAAENPLFGLPEIPPEYFRKLPEQPFIGLEYFKQQHAAIFFGRSAQIRQLYNYVTGIHPIILFYGESGVGKSSLLDAGLLPRLEHDYTVQYARRDATKGLTATFVHALQDAGAGTVEPAALLEAWCGIKAQTDRPLIVILDQAEETFTQPLKNSPESERELEIFLAALKGVFDQPGQRPRGKLILSYRKEYHPEIRDAFQKLSLPYAGMFLRQLEPKGIIEAVAGLTRSAHTREKYHLEIAESERGDLAETIATDLLADQKSTIAPVLQMILTKLWLAAVQEDPHAPRFTLPLYQQLKSAGIAMDEFLQQQMAQLQQWNDEVVASGLALDLLHAHTTPHGTAGTCSLTELQRAYSHRQEILESLLVECKRLYLLTDGQEKQNASTRLTHDILAPVIMREYQNSDKPGQRAARILRSKLSNFRIEEALLDDADLSLAEDGRSGMRQFTDDEENLITRSREEQAIRVKQFMYLDDRVTNRLKKLGYYDKYRNPDGKGIKHEYKTMKRHGEKLVVDHATGLTWQQPDSKFELTFADAEKYILDLNSRNFAGHNDWRLPTLEEAMALMEPQENEDGLHIDKVFGENQRYIWTSSRLSAGVAWFVDFDEGHCDTADVYFNSYVRAVRSGQS